MSGIYIHIPFCKSRCYYCDFYSTVKLSYKQSFLKTLITELKLRKNYLKSQKIKTIYFGGGTPSVLSSVEIQKIIDEIKSDFVVDTDCEITMEANPEDLTQGYIKNLTTTSINRVSIGIQSFNDTDLQTLNRIHNVKQAIQSIKILKSFGFSNISADLIYGLPKLSLKSWENNLTQFLELKIPHLSAYHLTYEDQTVFGHRLKNKKIIPLKENESINQYQMLCEIMRNNDYLHYEISNFCLPGNISQHNSSYWDNTNYLGLGPAAHSYNGNSRQWNQPNLSRYISNLEENKVPPHEKEILSKTDKFNDYILTRLRTKNGINLIKIKNEFPDFYNNTKKKIEKLKKNSTLYFTDNKTLRLTEKGFFVSDKIMENFMIIR